MVTRAIFLIGKSGFIPSSETTQLMGNVRKMRKLHLREVQVLFNQIEKLGLFRYFLKTRVIVEVKCLNIIRENISIQGFKLLYYTNQFFHLVRLKNNIK